MYLSDRDIEWALEKGLLICEVPDGVAPPKVDPTSIDLRLDHVSQARVWDVAKLKRTHGKAGAVAEVHLGSFRFAEFRDEYLTEPPECHQCGPDLGSRTTQGAGPDE